MNETRYLNYKQALAVIGGLDEEALGADGAVQLRELAQDMLLTRGADPDPTLVEEGASLVSTLLSEGALTPADADELWGRLCDSGPPARERAPVSA
jgi:hypothetical protein